MISLLGINISVYWSGLISFLVLLVLFLIGLRYYYSLKKHRSLILWLVGIMICLTVAYMIVVPILSR